MKWKEKRRLKKKGVKMENFMEKNEGKKIKWREERVKKAPPSEKKLKGNKCVKKAPPSEKKMNRKSKLSFRKEEISIERIAHAVFKEEW